MDLSRVHNIYFIGIGGIGMSAIARYFVSIGKNVAGFDRVLTEVTDGLEGLGVHVHTSDSISNIPDAFKDNVSTLVVYTPAIPKESLELNYFLDEGFKVLKRSEILGEITKNTFCLAVAGTHGKTTTSTILGHIVKEAGVSATSFLGGISENYNSNLILGGDEVSVVEADEFDRSFLRLSPNIACVTSMDADHLDIYGDKSYLDQSFREFSELVTDKLIVCKGLDLPGLTYAVEDDADYQAKNIRIANGSYIFDVKTPNGNVNDVVFHLPGKHNVSNALAALAIANEYGVDLLGVKKALWTFKGIHRRFSYRLREENKILIDDYAHHPTEINALIDSVSEMYPDKKKLGVFQPHLFTRTRDFIDGFAESLSKFDAVILLDIYPARELPIEGVDSQWLLDKITIKDKILSSKNELINNIKEIAAPVNVMIGAGDIGELVNDVKLALINEN